MHPSRSSAVVVGFVRTAFAQAHKGSLASSRPDDMLAAVLAAARARFLPAECVPDDVIAGCSFPEGEQGLNVARMAVLLAGFPDTVPGVTVNRFCGSSMTALSMAAGCIAAGAGDVFLAAGVESMTRIPMGGFAPMPHPGLYASLPEAYEGMGLTAERLARLYGISRSEQEAYALDSHRKAAASSDSAAAEIVPFSDALHDECVRAQSTAADLAKLKPAFLADGTVTAATSAPLTDGAACLAVTSERFAAEHGLKPSARILSFASTGCAPGVMGLGPVSASLKALERCGLPLEAMDYVEINEAFAAQVLAVLRELPVPADRLNVEGGALALGHPLGASGARVVGKAARLLAERGGKYALATMCVGGGQGTAVVLEATG